MPWHSISLAQADPRSPFVLHIRLLLPLAGGGGRTLSSSRAACLTLVSVLIFDMARAQHGARAAARITARFQTRAFAARHARHRSLLIRVKNLNGLVAQTLWLLGCDRTRETIRHILSLVKRKAGTDMLWRSIIYRTGAEHMRLARSLNDTAHTLRASLRRAQSLQQLAAIISYSATTRRAKGAHCTRTSRTPAG